MIPGTEKVEAADDQQRANYKSFKEYEVSKELKHYLELENEVKSSDFALRKKKILKAKYKTSEAFRKELRYNQLMKRAKGDEKSEELEKLDNYINSEEFILQKQFLTMKPAERYETTEEYQKETEYNTLKKSEKVLWYFKTKKKYPFKELERWDLTFDEKFDEDKLGSIEDGKLADMVVLGEDILEISTEKIKDIPIEMTIIEGQIVYER